MEVIKSSEIQKKEDLQGNYKGNPDDADVHAMKALLNKKKSADEISSLFSSQSKQVGSDLEKRSKTDKLEQKLKKYQENSTVDRDNSPENKDRDKNRDKSQENGSDDTDKNELAREVAEHILISDKDYTGANSDNEVRIKIKNSILKDAHVHIIQEKDCLQVKLISSDEQSIQTLVETRSNLEKQLEKNYKGLIKINIIHLTATDGSGF
ncbi:hypothetical protein KAJ27_09505 [bacterium]|nr:hypothetical protein [bacterium]